MSEVSNYGFDDEWSVSEKHPGYVVKTVVVGNVTVNVFRPILDPEERARREKEVMHNVALAMAPYLARKERGNA